MEFLLANHPLDCPICDQGGECDLQDQSMRYGSDRTRYHEVTGKRAVEDKDFGPLVKTVMTRCIQCTRCVRFANDVAGVEELGTTGRGNAMEIGTYVEKVLDSEMSANIIDLCPVGALTSKPSAFASRPWELKKTESIDVLDAIGSNIRVDSRGQQVMRIQPRLNDDVNEEWINDKTRYAYDGLRFQRLTSPLIRQGDRFAPASWPDALGAIAEGLAGSGAQGNEIKAVAGALADTESLVALKDLINKLGSDNTSLDRPAGSAPPVHGIDIRSNYAFNPTIAGAEESDCILMVGTNPRHEAAILNARMRKNYLHKYGEFGLIGEKFESVYEFDHIGTDLKALQDFASGKATSDFAQKFANAEKPMIIVGSAVAEHAESAAMYDAINKLINTHKSKILTPDWNGLSTLQRVSSLTSVSRSKQHMLTFVLCVFRPLLTLPLSTSASFLLLKPPRFSPSSCTSSTLTTSTLRPSPRTLSSSTRATTVTSVPNTPMFACLALHTPKRPSPGSTPKAAASLAAPLCPHPAPLARTGRSSVL